MKRFYRACGAIVVVALAFAAPAGAYVNDRFGVSADIPADWKSDPPPDNNDGLTFHSPDGAATILVYGNFESGDSLAQSIDELAKPDAGERITLRKLTPQSVTVSGFSGDNIFYRRSLLTCGGKVWNNVAITYPAARKADYDALVTRVAGSLRGTAPYGEKCR